MEHQRKSKLIRLLKKQKKPALVVTRESGRLCVCACGGMVMIDHGSGPRKMARCLCVGTEILYRVLCVCRCWWCVEVVAAWLVGGGTTSEGCCCCCGGGGGNREQGCGYGCVDWWWWHHDNDDGANDDDAITDGGDDENY